MAQMQCEHIINTGQKLCNTVRSPRAWGLQWERQIKTGGPAKNYVIKTELRGANSIYDQFTTMATVNKITNMDASKAPRKAKG